MAKQLAQQLGYLFVDSGAMYRAVALYALRNNLLTPEGSIQSAALQAAMPQIKISFVRNAATGLPETCLCGEIVEQEIRNIAVSQLVSHVAALPFVREALLQQQRLLGREGGIVMDGRDIGTAVFPEAELKIFVTASADVRAQRRFDELQAKGMPVDLETIKQNIIERDRIDTTRSLNPLRKAEDAVLLDNSHMSRSEQSQWLLEQVKNITGKTTKN